MPYKGHFRFPKKQFLKDFFLLKCKEHFNKHFRAMERFNWCQ